MEKNFLLNIIEKVLMLLYKPLYQFYGPENIKIVIVRKLIPKWAFAQTVGTTVFIKDYNFEHLDSFIEDIKNVFPHEYIHVLQYRNIGNMFFFYYFLDSFLKFLQGKHYYYDNVYEKEAREKSLNLQINFDWKKALENYKRL